MKSTRLAVAISALTTLMILLTIAYVLLPRLPGGKALAQSPPAPVYFTTGTVVNWTHSGKDALGKQENLRDSEVGLFAAGVNPNAAGVLPLGIAKIPVPFPGPAGANIGVLFQAPARVDGDYQLAVRVYDQASNVSQWGPTFVGSTDGTPPSSPSAPKIVINITIGS